MIRTVGEFVDAVNALLESGALTRDMPVKCVWDGCSWPVQAVAAEPITVNRAPGSGRHPIQDPESRSHGPPKSSQRPPNTNPRLPGPKLKLPTPEPQLPTPSSKLPRSRARPPAARRARLLGSYIAVLQSGKNRPHRPPPTGSS